MGKELTQNERGQNLLANYFATALKAVDTHTLRSYVVTALLMGNPANRL